MEGNHSSTIPPNYVTLKDLQERWIKRKQQQEEDQKLLKLGQEEQEKLRKLRQDEQTKLHKLRQEEEYKPRKQKQVTNPTPKSKTPNRFPRKKKPEAIENKPAVVSNVRRSEAIGIKSEPKNRRSGSSHIMQVKESQKGVEIGDKKEKEISRKEPTAEIINRGVANIAIDGEDKGRRDMISSRSYGRLGWRGRGRGRISSRESGMVWVRKTTDG